MRIICSLLFKIHLCCRFHSNWALNLQGNSESAGGLEDEASIDDVDGVDLSKVSGNGGSIAVHMIPATSLSNIKIINSIFLNNTAETYGGTLYFGPYVTGELENNTFQNVFVDNEQSMRPRVGDVLEFRGSMQFISNIINVITADSSIPIVAYRASDIGSFMESDKMEVLCPVGYNTELVSTYVVLSPKRKPIETLLIYCVPCNDALYSLTQSHIMINNLNIDYINRSTCIICPYGAQCKIDVHAKANFWGQVSDGKVAMYLCPEDYCCQNLICKTFDACASNRVGALCGQCDEGYSESLFSTECIRNDKCTYASSFWVVIVVYGILYVVFFILEEEWEMMIAKLKYWLKTTVFLSFIRNMRKWCCSSFTVHRTQRNTSSMLEDDGTVGAYLSIFMYYIQIPHILKVSILYRDGRNTAPLTELLYTIKNIFSFNTFGIHLKTCIFEGVTAVFKIWIRLAFVMYLFGALVFLYILIKPLSIFIGPQRESSFFYKSAPINAKFIAAFVSLLLYTYQYFAENSFAMLKCIDIESTKESVLFIDANIICYQSWQFAVIIFVCVYVIPFATVLAIAPDLMRRNIIGIKVFILSLFIPLFSAPFLIVRFIKERATGQEIKTGTKDDPNKSINKNDLNKTSDKNARHLVSRVLCDPYKNTFAWGICWEGVIALRRLLLIVIATLTPSLLFRHILLSLGCQLALVTQLIVKPFVRTSCNIMETISLSIILLVSIMNLLKAAYFQSGEIPDSTADKVFEVYDWIEAILFGIVPLVFTGLIALGVLIRMTALPFQTCRAKQSAKFHNISSSLSDRKGALDPGYRYYNGTPKYRKHNNLEKTHITNQGVISDILQMVQSDEYRHQYIYRTKSGHSDSIHQEPPIFQSPVLMYSGNYGN